MDTWQIILTIIIVGLSIIMPIYYSQQNKKKTQEEEFKKIVMIRVRNKNKL